MYCQTDVMWRAEMRGRWFEGGDLFMLDGGVLFWTWLLF